MCELLEKAREVQGNISYYEVAKRLGVSDQVMTKWKQDISKPNGVNTLKLAEMAKLSPAEALKLIEGGFAKVSLLLVTAAFSAAILFASNPMLAANIHYAKLMRRKQRELGMV